MTLIAPAGLRRDQTYLVRIYVNTKLVRERPLADGVQVALAGIPLDEGDNAIRAALVGTSGQGDLSAELHVTRDSSAPIIRVLDPQPGATVYNDSVVLRGRTEAGADITITELSSGREIEATIDPEGRFQAPIALAIGANQFVLRSQDLAGNQARARITFVREASAARLRLYISARDLDAAQLPVLLEMVATVLDEEGRGLDGVQVTFSLSPPNQTTRTYRTTTIGGQAAWPDLQLVDEGSARGTWLVTVLALLPSGAELRENQTFSVR